MKKNKTTKKIRGTQIYNTGEVDMRGNEIWTGDILVGKTDELHPAGGDMGISAAGGLGELRSWGLKERDFVRKSFSMGKEYFKWNGHALTSVSKNVLKVGTIFSDPQLLL